MEWQTGRTVNKCEKREHHEPSGLSATHLLGRFLLSATLTIESLLRGLNVDVGRRLPADMGMDDLLGLHLADGSATTSRAKADRNGASVVVKPLGVLSATTSRAKADRNTTYRQLLVELGTVGNDLPRQSG